jgi:phospholipid/cholesterol/gamma-HCH transport system ATP-binding protein
MPAEYEACISVANLDLAYGDVVIQRNLTFAVECGEIFIIMGRSGCGKSTLLRHLIGLHQPVRGEVRYHGESLWGSAETRERLMGRFGVLYQRGALWSSMTLAENVALPLQEFTDLSPMEIQRVVALKLALVGLAGYEAYYPSQLSGGMQKRAGLARAMALDPAILFLDEPSAGLDPVSAKRLDDLILELRDGLAATVVVVTHELASIFGIGDRAVFLDVETHTLIAEGKPSVLLQETTHPAVREFLTRGAPAPPILPTRHPAEGFRVPACAGRHPEGAI